MLSLIERCGQGWSVSLVRGVRSSVASSFRFLPIAFHERLFSSSHNQEMLYVPFATDFKREHASIMFWVSKNTNLKEVNVNIRVSLSISPAHLRREPIFLSGVFPSIATFISITVLLYRAIRTKT